MKYSSQEQGKGQPRLPVNPLVVRSARPAGTFSNELNDLELITVDKNTPRSRANYVKGTVASSFGVVKSPIKVARDLLTTLEPKQLRSIGSIRTADRSNFSRT